MTYNKVGLGTFPLADVFSHISSDDSKKLVQQFIDKGGYYIDTAPMYGFGEIENLLGIALSSYSRDKYYIVTKCGYIDVEGKTFQTIQKSGKFDNVIRECERSLKRLKTDYIDLYFMHSPDPNTPIEETLRAMEKLQSDGKIKEIGVSNVNLLELKEYNKSGKIKFIQNRFSLINRSIEPKLEKYMMDNSIKLVPYQVIDRGQLTGKVFEGIQNLRKEDLRNGKSDWLPDKLDVIAEWVKSSLSPIAKRLGITLGQLSIAWALHQQFMGFVIVGNTHPEYTEINLKANDIKLTPEILKEIDNAYASLETSIKEKYGQTIREFRGLNAKYY
jgi:aryl-alcohol dehydrogenase-like predicted oxidoreductase